MIDDTGEFEEKMMSKLLHSDSSDTPRGTKQHQGEGRHAVPSRDRSHVMTSTTAVSPDTRAPGKGWHIGLWVAQVLLAMGFGMAGFMKLVTPYAELAQTMAWAQYTPEPLIKFIGTAELAGALGLILPAATRIKPFLTPLAATGFIVIMLFASGLHLSLGELPVPNMKLGGIAVFIAWGRWRKAPISPRA